MRDPYENDDWPTTETEACDCCGEPWAGEVDRDNGPRKLRLCEAHYDLWTRSEREFNAEVESVAGREQRRPGTARTIALRYGDVG